MVVSRCCAATRLWHGFLCFALVHTLPSSLGSISTIFFCLVIDLSGPRSCIVAPILRMRLPFQPGVGPIVWNPQPHEHTTLPSYFIQPSPTLYLGAHAAIGTHPPRSRLESHTYSLSLVAVQPCLTCLALLWHWNSYPPHPPRPPTTLLITIPTPFSALIPAYTPQSPWCAVHHCSSPPRSSWPPTVFFYGWYGSLVGHSAADEGGGVIGMGRDIDIMGLGWRRRRGMRDRGRRVFCAGRSAAELDTQFRRLDPLFLFVHDSSLPTH